MVRILIKGGVWKNTEDEILKAAVMKYGKNQWARVASLLNRKTASQCKSRWYEWLDPSVKKTEWSKEEEEKLLHLAKLMPNQWRTIAPIVGRTAGQCMEHYERLLDEAQEGGATATGADDPRRLKPGEIDPNPETKPARPDPIDMDEDEKEMLSEARARLANTLGKKAKRKARERQLEEARRLSMVQKRRELKAAGIQSKLGTFNPRKGIDYAREIPFQQVAPAGFFDVSEEVRIGKTQVLNARQHSLELAKMEGRHQKEEEERERQKEARKLKQLFKANAPEAVAKMSEALDPTALRRRGQLSLPAPQVSDAELEDIVKVTQQSSAAALTAGGASSTQGLLGDYSNYAASLVGDRSTPMRTPMQESVIMQEAKNLRILREMTPLLDGQRDSDLPELYEGTGFAGVQPKNARLATPNVVFGTPMHGGHNGDMAASDIGSVMGTPARFALPSSGGSVVSTTTFRSSSATPLLMRDQFGLNAGTSEHVSDTMSVSGQSFSDSNSVFSIKARENQLKSILAAQLKSLPEPEFTYDIALPEAQGDDEAPKGPTKPEDAADIMAREEKKKRDAEQAELARRSTVLKRSLPRPNITSANRDAALKASDDMVDALASLPDNKAFSKEELKKASASINAEALALVAHEAFKYPDAEALARRSGTKRPVPVDLPLMDDALMQKARDAVAAEMRACTYEPYSAKQFESAWTEVYNNLTYVPATASKGGHFAPSASLTKTDVIASAKYQCDAILNKVKQLSAKSDKIESKLQVTQQGYQVRSRKLQEQLHQAFQQYQTASVELSCYEMLLDSERRAIQRRQEDAASASLALAASEAEWQERYRGLLGRKKARRD